MGEWPRKLINVLIVLSIVAAIAVVAALAFSLVLLAPSVSIGQPQTYASDSNTSISVFVPFNISNPGLFAITGPSIYFALESSDTTLLSFSSNPITIPAGSPSRKYNFTVTVNLSNLPMDELKRLVTSNDTLALIVRVSVGMFPLAGIGASVDAVAEWSPIVTNLTFLTPSVQPINLTHAEVALPFTFINPSDLDVPAVIAGNLTSTYGASAQFSQELVIHSNSPNSGSVSVAMPLPENMTEYLFSPSVFNISALAEVTVFGLIPVPFNVTYTVDWGAPLTNLTFGDPAVGPINSSHSIVAVPFNFTNANDFVTAEGSFTATILLPNGSVAGTSQLVTFLAPPHTSFASNAAFTILNSSVSPSYTLVASFETPYGNFQKEVQIGG